MCVDTLFTNRGALTHGGNARKIYKIQFKVLFMTSSTINLGGKEITALDEEIATLKAKILLVHTEIKAEVQEEEALNKLVELIENLKKIIITVYELQQPLIFSLDKKDNEQIKRALKEFIEAFGEANILMSTLNRIFDKYVTTLDNEDRMKRRDSELHKILREENDSISNKIANINKAIFGSSTNYYGQDKKELFAELVKKFNQQKNMNIQLTW